MEALSRKDAKDEGPTVEDEDPAARDEGFATGDEARVEEYAEPEGLAAGLLDVELRHGIIQSLSETKQFFGHDKEDPMLHSRLPSTDHHNDGPQCFQCLRLSLCFFHSLSMGAAPNMARKRTPTIYSNLGTDLGMSHTLELSDCINFDTFLNALNINDQDSLNSAAVHVQRQEEPKLCSRRLAPSKRELKLCYLRWCQFSPKCPSHYGILRYSANPNLYDHVNPATKRTIDQSAGGKIRDGNAKESWAILKDLALYGNESWNDPRDFAKPVKAISLPQDVLKTSDRHLIELENQVQCLTEAHLASKKHVQVNKVTSLCEICSGPHDTQYCMENIE
ncbi:hypothetical protein Tco_0941499 [Tanacetum coccineum]|uniref:MAK10-like protein n=1 Tax=Tanacetum coccineum TaxID=301880 RepID=A0ABQ5DXQ4_9ASTR